ncbi:TIGR04290 family methyltransferase [Terriglobus albidus]|uniref:TIGR04290 family methyltransferase n=1 Tax=Terriglobus albidus TaxID=1592106 RepID=UPI0021DFA548|nr:TIGR04290 family methyltransferase [Terriglobus albidus]
MNNETQQTIQSKISELAPWFHNLRLAGVETAPAHFLGDYPSVKWERFRAAIPEDLSGKSVLDIGCNAGFYSLEMKRRGAARVLGIDSDERYLEQAKLAAEIEDVDIDFQNLSVWDIALLQERFDLVLFMGVFYHLRHPLLALDLIHEFAAKDLLVFQSLQRGSNEIVQTAKDYDFSETGLFDRPDYPRMHFIEHSYAHDPTNWWVPNRACVEAMLRSAGFNILSHPEEEVYVCSRREIPVPPDGPHCVFPAKDVTR